MIYRTVIKTWFEAKLDLTLLEQMLQTLQSGHIATCEHTLRRVVTEIMSYYDLSGEPEYESMVVFLFRVIRMFHGLVHHATII